MRWAAQGHQAMQMTGACARAASDLFWKASRLSAGASRSRGARALRRGARVCGSWLHEHCTVDSRSEDVPVIVPKGRPLGMKVN